MMSYFMVGVICVCVCVSVCLCVCVYKQVRRGRRSISQTWRKWCNLRLGVREVMDFNAVIVVNGSLN